VINKAQCGNNSFLRVSRLRLFDLICWINRKKWQCWSHIYH